MLDSIFTDTSTTTITFGTTVAVVLSAMAIGLFISLVYMATHKKEPYTAGFVVALIMLPAIIAMIILLVGNNVARAFSLAGAFSLIRFRSAPGNSKDIAYVFFTLGVGLACGMGYIAYAVLFALMMCAAMAVLTLVQFGAKSSSSMLLKVTVPESLQYDGMFEPLLAEYTTSHKLVRVKTVEFGSLFELTFEIMMKDALLSKQLIDNVRTQNGNLGVTLSQNQQTDAAVF